MCAELPWFHGGTPQNLWGWYESMLRSPKNQSLLPRRAQKEPPPTITYSTRPLVWTWWPVTPGHSRPCSSSGLLGGAGCWLSAAFHWRHSSLEICQRHFPLFWSTWSEQASKKRLLLEAAVWRSHQRLESREHSRDVGNNSSPRRCHRAETAAEELPINKHLSRNTCCEHNPFFLTSLSPKTRAHWEVLSEQRPPTPILSTCLKPPMMNTYFLFVFLNVLYSNYKFFYSSNCLPHVQTFWSELFNFRVIKLPIPPKSCQGQETRNQQGNKASIVLTQ